jgi:hypothetical protein
MNNSKRISKAFPALFLMKAVAFTAACALLVPLVPGTVEADPANGGTAHPWKFQRILGASTVELSVGWTACNPELVPRFRKSVTESRGRAKITIFEKAREVPPGTHCVRSRGKTRLRVRLHQQLEKLKVFDGSSSPPVLRFRGHRSK